jgi:hypothetical protein
MNITLRKGRPDDAQRAGSICYEALKVLAEGPELAAQKQPLASYGTWAKGLHILSR